MTKDEAFAFIKKANQTQDLLGKITVVSERIGWLERGDPIELAFGGSTLKEKIVLKSSEMDEVRAIVLNHLKGALAAYEAQLADLTS